MSLKTLSINLTDAETPQGIAAVVNAYWMAEVSFRGKSGGKEHMCWMHQDPGMRERCFDC